MSSALLRAVAAALIVTALVRFLGPLPELRGRALGPLLAVGWSLAAPIACAAWLAARAPRSDSGFMRRWAVLGLQAAFAGAIWLTYVHLVQPDVLRKRALVLAAAGVAAHVAAGFLPQRRTLASGALVFGVLGAAMLGALAPELQRFVGRAAVLGPAGRANLLLITIDTVRQDALGCYGNRLATSPHLDRLAAEGVVFEDALSQSPHTHASIATLLTSTYPREHRSRRESQRLAPENVTLAEHLSGHGYHTAAFLDNPWLSRELGFDQGYRDFEPHSRAGAAEAWLAEHAAAGRFFLHVHLLQPHAPYLAVEPWAQEFQPDWPVDAPYQRDVPIQVLWDAKRFADVNIPAEHIERMRALYAAEVRAMDEQIGALLRALAEAGAADDTLVVVASDHGEEFLEHGSLGHSHSLYQELVRVPLLMRLPGKRYAGLRVAQQAQLLDVAPTVTDLLGVTALPNARGGSWVAHFEGGAAPASADLAFAEVYRVDTRHIFLASTPEWTLHAAVVPLGRDRYEDWTLTGPEASDFALGTRVQLFDRETDPHEQSDLAAARPEVVQALLAALEEWRRAPIRGSEPRR